MQDIDEGKKKKNENASVHQPVIKRKVMAYDPWGPAGRCKGAQLDPLEFDFENFLT